MSCVLYISGIKGREHKDVRKKKQAVTFITASHLPQFEKQPGKHTTSNDRHNSKSYQDLYNKSVIIEITHSGIGQSMIVHMLERKLASFAFTHPLPSQAPIEFTPPITRLTYNTHPHPLTSSIFSTPICVQPCHPRAGSVECAFQLLPIVQKCAVSPSLVFIDHNAAALPSRSSHSHHCSCLSRPRHGPRGVLSLARVFSLPSAVVLWGVDKDRSLDEVPRWVYVGVGVAWEQAKRVPRAPYVFWQAIFETQDSVLCVGRGNTYTKGPRPRRTSIPTFFLGKT